MGRRRVEYKRCKKCGHGYLKKSGSDGTEDICPICTKRIVLNSLIMIIIEKDQDSF